MRKEEIKRKKEKENQTSWCSTNSQESFQRGNIDSEIVPGRQGIWIRVRKRVTREKNIAFLPVRRLQMEVVQNTPRKTSKKEGGGAFIFFPLFFLSSIPRQLSFSILFKDCFHISQDFFWTQMLIAHGSRFSGLLTKEGALLCSQSESW